jgi:hypothetical protein
MDESGWNPESITSSSSSSSGYAHHSVLSTTIIIIAYYNYSQESKMRWFVLIEEKNGVKRQCPLTRLFSVILNNIENPIFNIMRNAPCII